VEHDVVFVSEVRGEVGDKSGIESRIKLDKNIGIHYLRLMKNI
jgi:hypothetical protein